MRIPRLHEWDLPTAEAKALQAELAARVSRKTPAGFAPKYVAGADMSFRRGDTDLFGAVVILELPGLKVVETATARTPAIFPYVPGYLSFREGPVLLQCFEKLKRAPDAVLFDAQGIAHPRRLGLASHLGVWTGLPSVGVAKTRFIGTHPEVGLQPGDRQALIDDGRGGGKAGERIGTVLRTRKDSRPIYISIGHRIDLRGAEALVRRCLDGVHRLPEPTRLAHAAVNEYRKRET